MADRADEATAAANDRIPERARLAQRHARAWILLVAALGLHVVDEALTGFLAFYNPLVESIRARIGWFPMPAFRFDVWLAGLVLLVVVLALAGPAVRRGAPGTTAASWALGAIMLLNGVGHLAGSLYFGRWLPGATTAPLLLAGGVMLAHSTWRRTHA